MSGSLETTTDALPSQPRGDLSLRESNNGRKAKESQPTGKDQYRSGMDSPPLRESKKSKSKKTQSSRN